MRYTLLLLLVFASSANAVTWHICPDTDSTNTDLNYGTEDGTSQANCFDGFADAWASAGDIDAGDIVQMHGTFYNERGYIQDSGTNGNSIMFVCGSDCLFWLSVNVAGNYTVATTPFGQTTGSSWQLVAGQTDIYKKGVGTGIYKMWVDDVEIPHAPTVPATETDAGAVATFTAINQFIQTTEDLDGFTKSLYFKGTPTDSMRVNKVSTTSEAYSIGGFVDDGFDYITFAGMNIRGFTTNRLQAGALAIQNTTGTVVIDPRIYESKTGIRAQANTNLYIYGQDCFINNNSGGVSFSGQRELSTSAGAYFFISAISKANPGQIDTIAAHGLANGEKVLIQGVSGMTQINSGSTERTVTVVDSDSFTAGVDTTSFSTYTSGGEIWVQRTDGDVTIEECEISDNGGYAFYNSIAIDFNIDGDGIGAGYLGGTMNKLTIKNNRLLRNGPRRLLIAGETGDVRRGSGIYIGTAQTFSVRVLRVVGNYFEGNNRYNLHVSDTLYDDIAGNIFAGITNLDAATAGYQLRHVDGNVLVESRVVNNVVIGESGAGGMSLFNTVGSEVWRVHDNVFGPLTKSSGDTWTAALNFSSTNAVNESHNKFISAPGDAFWQRNGVTYTTAAAWAAASSQGASDEIITDAGWDGGAVPTSREGFCLGDDSVLLNAGLWIGAWVLDNNGHSFDNPPHIGALSWCRDRAPAATRPASAARAAAAARPAAASRAVLH